MIYILQGTDMHQDLKRIGRDWNEGHPDHEGEMAVSQLHRISGMANMLLDIIEENDELPGWVQYKLGRAYNDLNDLFGYIESKSHDDHCDDDGMMILNLDDAMMHEAKKKKQRGLWANIRARRKAGKPKLKPGQKGYPKTLSINK